MEWFEILFIVLAAITIPAGIIFSVLPPLPGPIVAWLGVLFMYLLPDRDTISLTWLIILLLSGILATLLDFYLPIAATKKHGGTKAGVWGGTIGTIIGAFFLPGWGILVGPLVGAIIGDLIGGNRFKAAMKSGFGSFMGLLLATSIKLAVSLAMGAFVVVDLVRMIARLI